MRRAQWAVLAIASALAGCNSSDAPVRVWGHVTLDGKPMTGANVRFEPEAAGGQSREVETTETGYEIPAAEGLRPGAYRVKIVAFRPTGQKRPNPYKEGAPPIDVLEQYAPKVYSTNETPLRVTVNATKDGNQIDLELKSDRATKAQP